MKTTTIQDVHELNIQDYDGNSFSLPAEELVIDHAIGTSDVIYSDQKLLRCKVIVTVNDQVYNRLMTGSGHNVVVTHKGKKTRIPFGTQWDVYAGGLTVKDKHGEPIATFSFGEWDSVRKL